MFGIGFFELIIIAVVALVVVGPKRLPEVMKQAGRLFVHVRRTANDVRSTFDQVIREAENEIRMEEAANLRQALQPVLDAKKDMASLITAQSAALAPQGAASYTPGATLSPPQPAAEATPVAAVASTPTEPATPVAGQAPTVPPGLGEKV